MRSACARDLWWVGWSMGARIANVNEELHEGVGRLKQHSTKCGGVFELQQLVLVSCMLT